jgi:excisionase family DNA binding protein
VDIDADEHVRKQGMKPGNAATPRPIMTTKEVAEYLQIPLNTVYELIKRAEIPTFKILSDHRFHRGEIDKWAAERRSRVGTFGRQLRK